MAILIGNQIQTLATVTGINAKTVASTNLYTVPTGRSVYLTGVYIRCSAASAITVGATAQVEVSASSGDIYPSQTWTNMLAANDNWSYVSFGKSIVIPAASIIKLNITVAATGTSQTVIADVIGHLI